jgi:hypothetical protein
MLMQTAAAREKFHPDMAAGAFYVTHGQDLILRTLHYKRMCAWPDCSKRTGMYLHFRRTWCSIKKETWKYFGYTPKFHGAAANYLSARTIRLVREHEEERMCTE